MEMTTVKIPIPEGCNIILGQTHFIKTAEDLYEIIATTVPRHYSALLSRRHQDPVSSGPKGTMKGSLLPA